MTRADRAKPPRRATGFAETVVWKAVRAGRAHGFKFRRQHPIDHYVVDFACPELKLVIEIDGGIHTLPAIAERDILRQRELETLGWIVLRFSNDLAVTSTTEILEAIERHAISIGRG